VVAEEEGVVSAAEMAPGALTQVLRTAEVVTATSAAARVDLLMEGSMSRTLAPLLLRRASRVRVRRSFLVVLTAFRLLAVLVVNDGGNGGGRNVLGGEMGRKGGDA
jgi:hypothetical protein